jgi:hypothetical protein
MIDTLRNTAPKVGWAIINAGIDKPSIGAMHLEVGGGNFFASGHLVHLGNNIRHEKLLWFLEEMENNDKRVYSLMAIAVGRVSASQ